MEYRIVEGSENMRMEDVTRLLKMTYWADKRSPETIEMSVRNSFCYGVYVDGNDRLAGFARVITDCATAWYLCDVIIDPDYRHHGLGKALLSHIIPKYDAFRGFLFTRDAHSLYRKYGFEIVNDRTMVRAPG